MKQLAFIWDMDGTLVDSYPAIAPPPGRRFWPSGWTCRSGRSTGR